MKNVTLVAHSPNSGGAARMLSHLAEGLCRSENLKPTVILGDGDKPVVGIGTANIPCFFGPTGNAYIVQQSSNFPQFAKRSLHNASRYVDLFFRSRSDIVLINTLTNYDAVLGARIARLPYVVWIHGIVGGAVNEFDELKPIIDRTILQNAAGLVCCSDWTRDYFKNLVAPSRLQTIENWTTIPELGPQSVKDAPYQLAMLCSLEDHKSVDTAIWAVALLKKDGVNVVLNVHGDGPKKEELEALVRTLKLKSAVRFLGKTDDTLSVYRSSFATLVTSTVESFGMTAIESMAAGTLVIASRAGGLPAVVHDSETGILFDTKDPTDLARKILFAINNPAEAFRISRNGRQIAEQVFDGQGSLSKFEKYLISCEDGFVGYAPESDYDVDYLRVAAKSETVINDSLIWQHACNLEQELAEIRASTSWRFSKPIRLAGRFLSKKHRAKIRAG